MASKGDKFIIEIESTYIAEVGDTPAVLYKMKGFNSLVFDQQGIEKLTPYNRKDYPHGFKIGDEVLDQNRGYGVVVRTSENGIMYLDAETITWFVPIDGMNNIIKTGVRYPEMQLILDDLDERRRSKK